MSHSIVGLLQKAFHSSQPETHPRIVYLGVEIGMSVNVESNGEVYLWRHTQNGEENIEFNVSEYSDLKELQSDIDTWIKSTK